LPVPYSFLKKKKEDTVLANSQCKPKSKYYLKYQKMKIAILTCEKLPDLTQNDQLLIPALAKVNIAATAVIWNDKTVNWSDFDYLIFRNTWDYF
jgi:hypothetical protein